MSRFTLRPEAVRDLESLEDYIAQDDVEQAALFIERVRTALTLLATQPEMGRLRPELSPQLRSFAVGNYVVFYVPATDGIDVVRVLSGARDIDTLL